MNPPLESIPSVQPPDAEELAMIFERFEDAVLSQYSYAVGCEGAGEVVIVDPRRDVDGYLAFAAVHGLRITHVLETHVHADFASGARELAARSGATMHASGHDEGEAYQVAFEHKDLFDGDTIQVGGQRIEARHTPGHTPEHMSFLVYDENRSPDVPMLMLSGDFLFVGSLGRPDLLGEEAKAELAGRLYESVQGLAGLPEGLEVHPGHGAGSMCGAGMSGRPTSTLGFERIANPYLAPGLAREEFIALILGSAPPFPDYYRRMKELNAAGPPLLGVPRPAVAGLAVDAVQEALDAGAVVVDLRDQEAFGAGHIPGAFGIGLGKLAMWASWTVPYETDIVLVADGAGGGAAVAQAARQLARVGLDDVRGYLQGGMNAWVAAGKETRALRQIDAPALQAMLEAGEAIDVLDVRGIDEFEAGHIAGAGHLLAGEVHADADELPSTGRPIAVMCRTGYRSTVAASVLLREGREDVLNVRGGISAWQQAGLPVAR